MEDSKCEQGYAFFLSDAHPENWNPTELIAVARHMVSQSSNAKIVILDQS